MAKVPQNERNGPDRDDIIPDEESLPMAMNLYPIYDGSFKVFRYSYAIEPYIDNLKIIQSILETAIAIYNFGPYLIRGKYIFSQTEGKDFSGSVRYMRKIYTVEVRQIRDGFLGSDKNAGGISDNGGAIQKKEKDLNEVNSGILAKNNFDQVGNSFIYKRPEGLSEISDPERRAALENLSGIFPSKEIHNGNGRQKSQNQFEIRTGVNAKAHVAKNSGTTNGTNGNKTPSAYLEMDLSSKIFSSRSILDEWKSLIGKNAPNWSRVSIKDKETIENKYIGQKFITPYNNKTYRITGIAWDMTPESTFKWKRKKDQPARDTAYIDYFRAKYGLEISDRHQPLIIYERSNKRGNGTTKLYFIPEHCNLIDFGKSLMFNRNIRRQITPLTQFGPNERVEKVKNLLANDEIRKQFNEWNLNIGSEPVKIPGKKFPVKDVVGKKKGKNEEITLNKNNREFWLSSINRQAILEPITINRWAIVVEQGRNDNYKQLKSATNRVKERLTAFGKEMGIIFGNDFKLFITRTIHDQLESFKPREFDLVITIKPTQSKRSYKKAKEILENKEIAHQNVLHKSVYYKDRQKKNTTYMIIRALLRQIATKIPGKDGYGAALWKVEKSVIPENTLIMGIDVWHGTSTGRNSVAGFVFSYDKGLHWVPVAHNIPRVGWEFIKSIGEVIGNAIMNAPNPIENVIILRDGVGLYQFQLVLEEELAGIYNYLRDQKIGPIPKIAIISANKRIRRKIFEITPEGNYRNPRPGTFIEDDLIQSEGFTNYYMVSHKVSQGTANPVHYSILYNNTEIDDEELMNIVFELCHKYYNWAGLVRIPAPIEYAHKVAEQHANLDLNEDLGRLKKTMYFL